MARDKALRPDGFPALFYQDFWEMVKLDIIDIFEEFFDGTLEIERIKYAQVVLIPKTQGANTVYQFRL